MFVSGYSRVFALLSLARIQPQSLAIMRHQGPAVLGLELDRRMADLHNERRLAVTKGEQNDFC